MKTTALLILTSLISLNTVFAQENSDSGFQLLEGPYLGQKPPGLDPEVFAPGIVSINGRYEHGISFSPDLDEVYFSANKKDEEPDVYFSKLEGKKWTPIKKANFTKGEKDAEMHPFVSFSDNKIYFTAYDSIFSDENIWYVNRLDNSWSDAKKLDSPINDDLIFYPNAAKNGDLFYTGISKVKMYYAPNKNGRYPEVHELGIEYGIHGFISPSQDFLVVNARNKEDESRKDNDIYVYFKEKDGTWTKPINLGNTVNSNFNETCPSITPDGKYLFFGRYNEEGGLSNFYWVSTEVINKVRPFAQENSDADSPHLEGPYLGQKPPGLIPEAFAPGIVTTAHYEFGGVFTTDMKEFYLIRNGGKYEKPSFVVFQYKNNRWHESVISPWAGQPFIAPDGKTMHLGRRYMEHTESGWSAIKDLGRQFEDIRIMRLSASSKGTYYFDEVGTDGDGSIRYSRLVDGIREEPKLASKEINSGTWLAHPFIAPDESYLIWDGRRDNGYGNSDLYISYRQQDGSWDAAINLGDKINTDAWEASASVTPDGKYLFFHRMVSPGNVDMFWVDAQIIEKLKPR